MIATIMKGSVKALTDMGWEGLKLDRSGIQRNFSAVPPLARPVALSMSVSAKSVSS
eukprot:COSAG02_NODE_12070_length_1603_cov_1.240691_2_plen_56_part_00